MKKESASGAVPANYTELAGKPRKRQISEEKRKEYDLNQKMKMEKIRAMRKEERMEEKKTGEKKSKYLGFITQIYTALNYDRKTFCEATGLSSQMYYYLFVLNDDCYLGSATDMLKAIGVELDYRFLKDGQKEIPVNIQSENTLFELEAFLPESLRRPDPETKETSPVFERAIQNATRLGRLAQAMIDRNISARTLSEMLGVAPTTLLWWFDEKDDIKIQALYKIAELTGYRIKWVVKPVKKD